MHIFRNKSCTHFFCMNKQKMCGTLFLFFNLYTLAYLRGGVDGSGPSVFVTQNAFFATSQSDFVALNFDIYLTAYKFRLVLISIGFIAWETNKWDLTSPSGHEKYLEMFFLKGRVWALGLMKNEQQVSHQDEFCHCLSLIQSVSQSEMLLPPMVICIW